MDQTKSDKKIE